ncbi:MAG: phosphatase PAP2 family protein [Acidobacteriota bacterium]|nr:phosphatase PAP2 family protein [Acidobacteriota bacterium]
MDKNQRLRVVRRLLPQRIRRYVDTLEIEALMVLGVSLLSVIGVLAFLAIAGSVTEGDTQQVDETILRWFRDPLDPGKARGPAWLTEMAIDITAMGSTIVLIMVVLAVSGFLWLQNQTRLLALLIVAMAGGTALNALLKMTFARPRPSVVPHLREVFTFSFPSGHAALSAIVYLTIGVLLFEAVQGRASRLYCLAVAMTATFLVGFSRVFLGVHYPSDVLAGWAAGITWAALCWLAVQYVAKRRARTS